MRCLKQSRAFLQMSLSVAVRRVRNGHPEATNSRAPPTAQRAKKARPPGPALFALPHHTLPQPKMRQSKIYAKSHGQRQETRGLTRRRREWQQLQRGSVVVIPFRFFIADMQSSPQSGRTLS
jgi:hypothetical protein